MKAKKTNEKKVGIGTLCVQGGYVPACGEPRQVPIYQTTTFKYDTTKHMGDLFDLKASGYFYTRLANPTNDLVAKKIAALEGGVAAILTSSGQAASTFAVLNLAGAGDHVVSSAQIYGGTFNLFAVSLKKLGVEFTFVDPDADEKTIQAAFRPNTKCVFGETVANPSGAVLDIAKFARVAHRNGVPLIVDNTFPTPILCRPFRFGCDIVTTRRRSTWTATPPRSAAASSTRATSTGRSTPTRSPASSSPIRRTTAFPIRRRSASSPTSPSARRT